MLRFEFVQQTSISCDKQIQILSAQIILNKSIIIKLSTKILCNIKTKLTTFQIYNFLYIPNVFYPRNICFKGAFDKSS